MKKVILAVLLFTSGYVLSQNIACRVVSSADAEAVPYANVGILNKETGTVTNEHGYFVLNVSNAADNDRVRISIIGYETKDITVGELKKLNNAEIVLQPKVYELSETLILPGKFKRKKLGVTNFSRKMLAGFSDHVLGKEMGVLMENRKLARLHRINLSIGSCDHDTIFYRVNIYRVTDKRKMLLENILSAPIYLNIPKSDTKNTISLDISKQNLCVKGDFLVTVEYIKDLKKGNLLFSCGLGKLTYHRSTSQGNWKKVPIGVAINVEADVQQ